MDKDIENAIKRLSFRLGVEPHEMWRELLSITFADNMQYIRMAKLVEWMNDSKATQREKNNRQDTAMAALTLGVALIERERIQSVTEKHVGTASVFDDPQMKEE